MTETEKQLFISGEYTEISRNESRNMRMIAINGKTHHVALDPDRPIKPKHKGSKSVKKK